MNIDELRQYLTVNKHNLDDELVRQASLFYAVADAYEVAIAERDALKELLATTDAELDGKYRESLEKATEAAVKYAIQSDKDHAAAFWNYLDAKTKAGKIGALKEAYQQRNYMLRDLCTLYVNQYYSTQSVQGTSDTDTAIYRKQRERLASRR